MKYIFTIIILLIAVLALFSGCISLDQNIITNKNQTIITDINKTTNTIELDNNKNSNIEFIPETNIIDNTDSKMTITTRKELTLNDLKDINITDNNTNLINLNLESQELKPCTINIKIQNIDTNKYIYKTFNFTYKNYKFEYKIKLFTDLITYSEKLRTQYCYKFENNDFASRYTQDKYNNELIKKIANDFKDLNKYGFNNNEIMEIAIRFVQQIPYNYDINVENRYAYETLALGKGVCLDKTVILTKLLEYLGYETYIVTGIYDPYNKDIAHSTTGIICEQGKYILNNNKQFCQIETTNTFFVDELDYDGNLNILNISQGLKYIEDSYGPKSTLQYENNTELMKQIESELNKYKSNPKIYNKYANQYNDLIYENIALRFNNYTN